MARILWVEKQIDYEPQGMMSLSAVLKQAGHEVELTVAGREDAVAVARRFQPDILAYTVLTGSQRYYLELNRRIKRALGDREPMAVFGGPHATFFPDVLEEPGLDGVCLGEGEGAIVDLANQLSHGGFDPHLPNWWFKSGGTIVKNPVRPLIRDLGSLPMPDRSLIYDHDEMTRLSPVKVFIAGRGCPYRCTYCFNHAWYSTHYPHEKRGYMRPVDSVIAEAVWVRERYPLEQVIFVDDLFILFEDWLAEFAEKWPRQVGVAFFCNVRANLVTPEKVALLKKAGAISVSMGIESGSDRVRDEILKRRMSAEAIVQAGQLLDAAGIAASSTNMLALPTATLADDFATMRLNRAARIKYAHAFLFQPYPGTELGMFVQDYDLMDGNLEDISAIAWDKSLIKRDPFERRQMENLQRWFAIGVEFAWLEPLIRLAIRVPHNPITDGLYWWLHKMFKGYAIGRRIHPFRRDLRTTLRQIIHFFRMGT
jgi:anaerobic magnesium-protoporphyrin IX monomethyl ester cyclase